MSDVTEASDEQLVEWSGRAGYQGVADAQVLALGYSASAELTRRNTAELSALRAELAAAGERLERLTWVLVVLSIVMAAAAVVTAL